MRAFPLGNQRGIKSAAATKAIRIALRRGSGRRHTPNELESKGLSVVGSCLFRRLWGHHCGDTRLALAAAGLKPGQL
jgi:hypothetical protein